MRVPPSVRDNLILDNLKLVTYWAGRFKTAAQNARVDRDDLTQTGNLALVEAAEGWDPRRSRGAKFQSYAALWICYRMRDLTGGRVDLTGLDLDEFEERRPRLPVLVPLFPIPVFDPQSSCAHRGPIRRGSVLCCMVCHRSGIDGHSLLRPSADDPKPERRKAPRPARTWSARWVCSRSSTQNLRPSPAN